MDEIEIRRRTRERGRLQPAALDGWGIEDLRAYIAELKAEVARAEAAIAKQDTHKAAAEAFFRRPGG